VLLPARWQVLSWVNGALGKTAQPALSWDDRAGRSVLYTWPRSLLGAAYLQFAHAILSGRLSQTCVVCGRAFEVTKISSRNDRLTCSNTCRTRAYRDRQRKAQELFAGGRTPREIARLLGTTTDKVKAWVQSQNRKED
jgi:hypothetical protein